MTLFNKSFFTCILIVMLHEVACAQHPAALTHYRAGEALAKRNPDRAFQLLEQSRELAQENKLWDIYLLSVNKLASLELKGEAEKEQKVFAWLKEAAEVLKDAKEDSTLAQLHFDTGEFYNRLTNEIDAPIFHYQKAKKIWTALKGEWSEEVSNCYHGLGNIYKYYKYDFYEAEKCYEKALVIREKIQFKDQDALYKNYYSLAATNRSQHDFEKAISYGTKALDLARKSSPLRTEMTSGMIANIYRDMNELSLAKKYYLEALSLNTKTNDLATRAWYYKSLGETLKIDSSFSEAITFFNKAYSLYKTLEDKYQNLFLNLLINMVETYSLIGDEKNYARISKELLALLTSFDMLQSTEASQFWMLNGGHQFRKGNYDSALFYFQESLIAAVPSFTSRNLSDNPTPQQIGFRYKINETLVRKSVALRNKFLHRRDEAWLKSSLKSLELAEKLLSEQRNTLDMEDAKWKFLDSNYDIYEDIISTLYLYTERFSSDSVNALTFQYFEQSKARSLADALAQAEQTRRISSDDSLLQVHADLKRQLFSAQDAINRESDKPGNGERVSALREEVVRIDRDIQTVKFAMEDKYPGYFNVKYGYQPVSLGSVQKMLGAKQQILLEYFWGNESVYGMGVSKETIVFRRIGSTDSLGVAVRALLSHLTGEHSGIKKERFVLFTESASDLYDLLVKPFDQLLLNNKRIQIIPDGLISQVPFEILLQNAPRNTTVNYQALNYLIKSFTIGYAYSSSMFLRRKSAEGILTPSLLGVGFAGEQGVRGQRIALDEIAGAEDELKSLAKRFKTGKFLMGHDATESNFKSMAPDFDIIHLAIHGTGDLQKNFAASLYFQSERDTLDDGELHAYELYGLKLKALMAVLSSCESGLGKGYKGEGMISMANAFTYSGCENILMSLWKVNDQTSITLMDNFYEHLLAGESIDEALRNAKLSYLEKADELTAHPKIWAPLIAYGNLNGVFGKDRSVSFVIGGLCILLILLLSFKIYCRYAHR